VVVAATAGDGSVPCWACTIGASISTSRTSMLSAQRWASVLVRT
jgi:hypothetical protein